MALIEAHSVGVRFTFDRQHRPVTPLAAHVRGRCSTKWGLSGVDLRVGPGESVALLGPNMAGKTTLLRVLAGVLAPDEGTVHVAGRVGPLLSIEAGLMSTLTGRENAMVLGVLAGRDRRATRAALVRIRERSGLGEAFDRQVSSYSQGMRARLAFTVIDAADPEILLLDEVHEALDCEFRERLEARARAITQRGGIVIAAGHDYEQLRRLCAREVRLADGRLAGTEAGDDRPDRQPELDRQKQATIAA